MITLQLTFSFFFFFNDTATTEIYTLSLHDALPILRAWSDRAALPILDLYPFGSTSPIYVRVGREPVRDRKSTRLNSSHLVISYAVFCLKKKKKKRHATIRVACMRAIMRMV